MGMNFNHLGMSNNWQNWKGTSSSEPRKKTALLSIESWLFNRDPYTGWSLSPNDCAEKSPTNLLSNKQFFFIAKKYWFHWRQYELFRVRSVTGFLSHTLCGNYFSLGGWYQSLATSLSLSINTIYMWKGHHLINLTDVLYLALCGLSNMFVCCWWLLDFFWSNLWDFPKKHPAEVMVFSSQRHLKNSMKDAVIHLSCWWLNQPIWKNII